MKSCCENERLVGCWGVVRAECGQTGCYVHWHSTSVLSVMGQWSSRYVELLPLRKGWEMRMLCGAMNSFIARWRTRVYKLPTARTVHKARVIFVHYTLPCYRRPRIASAIAEDCFILAVFYLFSHRRFFDIPGPIFAKLCHTTRCVLRYFIAYIGVHILAPPLKIWGTKTPNFLLIVL